MTDMISSMPLRVWIVCGVVVIGAAVALFMIMKKRKQITPGTADGSTGTKHADTAVVSQQETPTYEYTKDGVVAHQNDAEEDAKRRLRIRRRNSQILIFMTFLFACGAFLSFGAYRYASLSLTPTAQIRDGTNAVFDIGAKDRTYYTTLNKWFTHIGRIDEQQFTDASSRIITKGYDTYLADVTDYIHGGKFFGFKRVELAPLARTLVQSYNTLYAESLESLKALNQYRYVTPEVTAIVQDGSDIQQPLMTIESIKLTTGLQFYLVLPDFIERTRRLLSIDDRSLLQKYYTLIRKDAESLTAAYVELCRLNPYENRDCSIFGDFDIYVRDKYSDIYTAEELRTLLKIFKEVVPIVSANLDESTDPILSIAVNSYDPEKNIISFAVEVSTYDDLYIQLRKLYPNKQPHIVIVSNLVNLLRLSTLIRGDGIRVDELTNEQSTELFNGEERVVVKSKYTFDVPLQSAIEREVYDTKSAFSASLKR